MTAIIGNDRHDDLYGYTGTRNTKKANLDGLDDIENGGSLAEFTPSVSKKEGKAI